MENNIEEVPHESGNSVNIKDFFWLCVSKWYWFAIALAITLGYAVYYMAKTPKTYQAEADILIKDDSTGASAGFNFAFSDITGMNASANINNEMISITSPVVIGEVVRRLGLDVNYTVKDKLRKRVLYGTELPFTVHFLDLPDNQRVSMTATFNGDSVVIIDKLTKTLPDKEIAEFDDSFTFNRADLENDTVDSSVGRILFVSNPDFKAPAKPLSNVMIDRVGYKSAAKRLRGALNAEVTDDYSTVMHLTLRDINAQRASDELQGIIDIYNENWIADKNQISISTSNFINERLGVIEDQLGDVDTDISSYKSQHQLPDVNAASQAFFQRSLQASEEVQQLTSRLALARSVRNHLSNVANSSSVLPASTGLEDVGIEHQISDYNTKLIQRNNLIANSSASNPIIIDMDNALAGMRQSILSAIDSYIANINASIRATQSTQAASSSRLAANPNQARYLLSVERQQKVKESLYLYLLQKREENELSQAFTAYNTKVITPPYTDDPVAPVSRNVFAMAFVLGLLIPGGILFLREMLDSTVRSRKDISKLSIPFIGEIPEAGKSRSFIDKILKRNNYSGQSQIIVKRKTGGMLNEAFRVIRTNLEFMIPPAAGMAKTIMITSANPGSGKTFITLNLAVVLSLRGKKVALLDLDLRKGTLSAVAGKPNVGLSNCLSGQANPSDIVIKNLDGNEGVDLYCSGPLPPNPAELLYNDRFTKLIDQLRKEYDYILIDCPPVEVVADAKIINRVADLTIFVIRAGIFERPMLGEIEKYYESSRYNNLAVILNGTPDPGKRANRSRYGYGYVYGYGKEIEVFKK